MQMEEKSQAELEVLFSNAGLKKDDESFYTWAADQSLALE